MYLCEYFIVLDISSDENIPNKNVFMCILYCIRYF